MSPPPPHLIFEVCQLSCCATACLTASLQPTHPLQVEDDDIRGGLQDGTLPGHADCRTHMVAWGGEWGRGGCKRSQGVCGWWEEGGGGAQA